MRSFRISLDMSEKEAAWYKYVTEGGDRPDSYVDMAQSLPDVGGEIPF